MGGTPRANRDRASAGRHRQHARGRGASGHQRRLRLDVSPADTLQVFVDDEYVGTLADFANEVELQVGTRRLALRAPGYEPLTIDVKITAGQTVTYRGALEPLAAAAPRANEPVGHRTFYLIPGCYIGNVPPEDVKLPPGCDVSRVIVHTPP